MVMLQLIIAYWVIRWLRAQKYHVHFFDELEIFIPAFGSIYSAVKFQFIIES